MNAFVDYLVSNWEVNGCVGIEKRFGHIKKIKTEKKTGDEMVEHIVTVGLKWYDKDNRLLMSDGVKFVNNILNENDKKKKLIKISGDELENRFMVAKNDILDVIREEYQEKINDINGKMKDLNGYFDKDGVAMSREFRGEHVEMNKKNVKKNKNKEITLVKIDKSVEKKIKKAFDM